MPAVLLNSPSAEAPCAVKPFPGTADLVTMLQQLALAGFVSGQLCRYAPVAVEHGFIRVSATVPPSLGEVKLYRATLVTAELTDIGHAWLHARLPAGSSGGATG
jgi:hypothetical protein